ncbi:hypothetical protein PEPS_14610 [Persicobacter psychrovividus]|uniref:Cadherin repeat domain-containing protein n=2 Tax=Persicobacter psychrovividus TaxID=387638 RepID=A0ABN6L836_9BACT|nr:hypothetical protein PEPS_14610 [Persicobacter psychrovividus]
MTEMKASLLLLLMTISLMTFSCGSSDDDTPSSGPVITAQDFTATIEEMPMNGQKIGDIDASTSSGLITYLLIDQSLDTAMEVNASTGEVTVFDSTLFDAQANPKITGQVALLNGLARETISVEVTVTEKEEDEPTAKVWDGAELTFEKAEVADENLPANQDSLTANVIITRGVGGGQIYNIAQEASANKVDSPVGTTWAIGELADYETLSFGKFRATVGDPKNVVGKKLVLHLIEDDIYLQVTFTKWSQGRSGGFAYTRSTPAQQVAAY